MIKRISDLWTRVVEDTKEIWWLYDAPPIQLRTRLLKGRPISFGVLAFYGYLILANWGDWFPMPRHLTFPTSALLLMGAIMSNVAHKEWTEHGRPKRDLLANKDEEMEKED